LAISEEQRIGWTDIFSHDLLRREVGNKEVPKIKIDDRGKNIIQGIQDKASKTQ
jgi:hypothetical protein